MRDLFDGLITIKCRHVVKYLMRIAHEWNGNDPRRTDAPRALAAESNRLISCGLYAVRLGDAVTASNELVC
jgi:hypothetical protein